MSHSEQINHFANEIQRVVDRFRSEYELPLASAVGVLNCVIFDLMQDAVEDEE